MCRDFGERGRNGVRAASGATWGPQARARTRALVSWTGVRGDARGAENVETAHIPRAGRHRGQGPRTMFCSRHAPHGGDPRSAGGAAEVEPRVTAYTRGRSVNKSSVGSKSADSGRREGLMREDGPVEAAGGNVGRTVVSAPSPVRFGGRAAANNGRSPQARSVEGEATDPHAGMGGRPASSALIHRPSSSMTPRKDGLSSGERASKMLCWPLTPLMTIGPLRLPVDEIRNPR